MYIYANYVLNIDQRIIIAKFAKYLGWADALVCRKKTGI